MINTIATISMASLYMTGIWRVDIFDIVYQGILRIYRRTQMSWMWWCIGASKLHHKSCGEPVNAWLHYDDILMGEITSPITSLTIVHSIVYSGTDQRRHQRSASLAFVREIDRSPVNSPHKGPVTRKMFPFDDVIMTTQCEVGVCRTVNGQVGDKAINRYSLTTFVIAWSVYGLGKPRLHWVLDKLHCIVGSWDWWEFQDHWQSLAHPGVNRSYGRQLAYRQGCARRLWKSLVELLNQSWLMQYYYHTGLPQVNSLRFIFYTYNANSVALYMYYKKYVDMTGHLYIIILRQYDAVIRLSTNDSTAFIWKLKATSHYIYICIYKMACRLFDSKLYATSHYIYIYI